MPTRSSATPRRSARRSASPTWSVLGQSFGGFCVVAYLSAFPGSLRAAYLTGGLPPLDRGIDEVYAETYRTSIAKSRAYYERYPEDRDRVAELVALLAEEDVRLPGGDRLTPHRLRALGHHLGMGTGAERLHHILELPWRSPAFLHDVEASSPFARNPLYAVIHESCYAPGIATRWSAQRLRPAAYDDDPTLLTSEHIYPWMFDEMAALQPFRDAAHLLADRAWGPLYDPEVLAANEVPTAAAVYADDMYVPRVFSEETAGRIRGLRMWLTNEYEHDGLAAPARARAADRAGARDGLRLRPSGRRRRRASGRAAVRSTACAAPRAGPATPTCTWVSTTRANPNMRSSTGANAMRPSPRNGGAASVGVEEPMICSPS